MSGGKKHQHKWKVDDDLSVWPMRVSICQVRTCQMKKREQLDWQGRVIGSSYTKRVKKP